MHNYLKKNGSNGNYIGSQLKATRKELLHDPATLSIYLKSTKALTRKDPCLPKVTEASFTVAKMWKQQKCL